jgi:hypothetical protein
MQEKGKQWRATHAQARQTMKGIQSSCRLKKGFDPDSAIFMPKWR